MEHQQQSEQLTALMAWLEDRLRMGDVPRLCDLKQYARDQGWHLSSKLVSAQLQLHPAYALNINQRRPSSAGTKQRPILGMTLGRLHMDIGFFTKSRQYETPPRYQSGYLVARDVVSRYVYIVVLRGNRRAPAMITALNKILDLHRQAGFTWPIRSIGFDKETSVMSKAVQAFLADQHIQFVAFQHSASKSKMAENCIRQIRTLMARLLRHKENAVRWWTLLPQVATTLNHREIYVAGKGTGYSPSQINADNLTDFIQNVYKARPADFYAQFALDPRLARFKYPLESVVRAKLIVTSSAVIGEKRSETNLTFATFKVVEHIPYVTQNLSLGRGYKCVDLDTQAVEIFDESDLTLASTDHNVHYRF